MCLLYLWKIIVCVFSYDDVLEVPLQPLGDNLDCFTYEIFEKDPVKYILYQNAIEQALIDKIDEKDIESRTVCIYQLSIVYSLC